MSSNSVTLMFLTSLSNRDEKEHLRPFRVNLDEAFILVSFFLLFGIETVVIGLSECQLALWVRGFVGGYGGGRIY